MENTRLRINSMFTCFPEELSIQIDLFHAVAEEYDETDFENTTESEILRKVYYNSPDFRKTLRLFRYILSRTFKSNVYFEKSLISGVVKLAKDNFFADLNVYECDVLESCFSEHYGIAQEELDEQLSSMMKRRLLIAGNRKTMAVVGGRRVDADLISRWFGGYRINNGWKMYNPLSVSRFLKRGGKLFYDDRKSDGNVWLIKRILVHGDVQADLIKLSVGKHVQQEDAMSDSVEVSYRDVGRSEFYSLLLHNGYLVVDTIDDHPNNNNVYSFKVPNLEMNAVFERSIKEWAKLNLPANANVLLHAMYRSLSVLNMPAFEQTLRSYIGGISARTLAKNSVANVYMAYVHQIGRYACKTYYLIYQEISSDSSNSQSAAVIVLVSKPGNNNNAIIVAYEMTTKELLVCSANDFYSDDDQTKEEQEASSILTKNLLDKTWRKAYQHSVREQYSYINETVTVAIVFHSHRNTFCMKWHNNDYIELFKNVKIPRIC